MLHGLVQPWFYQGLLALPLELSKPINWNFEPVTEVGQLSECVGRTSRGDLGLYIQDFQAKKKELPPSRVGSSTTLQGDYNKW